MKEQIKPVLKPNVRCQMPLAIYTLDDVVGVADHATLAAPSGIIKTSLLQKFKEPTVG